MVKIHNSTKDKILKLLLSSKEEEFSIRSISRKTSIDYKSAYISVMQLVKSKAVSSRKIGQAVLCRINKFNTDIFRAETIRRKELLERKQFYVLHDYFKDIKEPFFILLLFGSYASGSQRRGSDIDLMLIADNEDIRKKAKEAVSLIPLDIHLADFNSIEFLSMLKTTEFNVGKEAMKNNIILFGIEDYYRLVQND